MPAPTRRRFLQGSLAASIALRVLDGAANTALAGSADTLQHPYGRILGKVAPRASLDVPASPFSVGFETLDRKMFDPVRTYPHLAKLGAKWARVHTGWCRTETAPGRHDFAWLDEVVDSLSTLGIQPWFCVGFGNQLYTPDAPETAVGWVPTGTPGGKAAWLSYVGKLAEHFRGRVKHFEIWNEPNGTSFWRPGKPDPAQYVELVALTAPVIRQRIADAVIIGGAIAGMDTKFFQSCMENGLGEHIQKASFHSYRPIPEKNYEADVRQWRKIIQQHKPGIELWHGEVGAASQPGGAGGRANYPWTEIRQAKWLLRRFLSDLRMGIELVSCFHTVDLVNYHGSEGPSGKTNFKGLLRGTDYTPKPSYFAYQCLCALFDAKTARADSRIEPGAVPDGAAAPGEIQTASFTRAGKAIHAFWLPAGMEFERPDGRIDLTLKVAKDAQLAEPVLIDPLTQQVHAIASVKRRGDSWRFDAAPLADHPLLLTDHSVALA